MKRITIEVTEQQHHLKAVAATSGSVDLDTRPMETTPKKMHIVMKKVTNGRSRP